LYDTATAAVRDFEPVHPGQVGIYHCGLTVQGAPHVGHIYKEVVFDVLRRWLERSGFEVTVIANVTDIEDKILAKSADRGVPWWAHAYEFERELHWAYDVLGCRPPTYEPRATGHIPEMIELIEQLIADGHAYVAPDGSGDVYFDVTSWPTYGALSHQKIDDMEAAEDADPRGKRDPRDFALWKGWTEATPRTASWPAPWGRGRPGWHIECSAMAGKYLGEEFDIHGGGLDLRFPHHENELAQSTAVGQKFARFWMHNALVTTAGEKMSKSMGNSAVVRNVVERVRPIELRYYLVQSHYRSVVEFSFEALDEAAKSFRRIESFLDRARPHVEGGSTTLPKTFRDAMDDDLGTPAAIAVIHDTVREGNRLLQEGETGTPLADAFGQVVAMLDVLGLDPADPAWAALGGSDDAQLTAAVGALVAGLLDERAAARADKDWARADAIRARIAAAGIAVEDTADGPKWTLADPSEDED
jgi:cysteinyl-tRNA synthetase